MTYKITEDWQGGRLKCQISAGESVAELNNAGIILDRAYAMITNLPAGMFLGFHVPIEGRRQTVVIERTS
jgi:hypothetical protein